MNIEHDIIAKVYAAKGNSQAADDLVRQYLPFIKSETAKFLRRPPMEGHDDELGIAMFAFHEAALAYRKEKGAFLSLASTVIRSRLIDYHRREKRHDGTISLDQTIDGSNESRTLLEQVDTGHDAIKEHHTQGTAREEIMEFAAQLAEFDLSLTDIADNCPKQKRTLAACHQALAYAKTQPMLLSQLTSTRKLPIGPLASGSGIPRKTLERHRDYLIAILLAYTNGYEIIRGHLRQLAPQKEDRTK